MHNTHSFISTERLSARFVTYVALVISLVASTRQNCQTIAFTPSSLFAAAGNLRHNTWTRKTATLIPLRQASVSCLYATKGASDNNNSPLERNIARTCVQRFLTQRAVQSFMFLCAECRDPHTVRWLEEFGNTTDLLYYHGTGAFNTTLFEGWDSYLLDMVDRPSEFIIIQARRRGGGRGGWSKNNPYLQVCRTRENCVTLICFY